MRILRRAAIAAAIVGVAAWALGPKLRRFIVDRNQVAAYRALQRIGPAEYRFQSERRLDRDGDGIGEFGYLQQLSGAGFLDPEFGESARANGGPAIVKGYRFLVFLPLADGTGRAERGELPGFTTADSEAQERAWVVYAWPEHLGWTGVRAFTTNETTQIPWSSNTAGWDGAFGPTTGVEAYRRGDGILGTYASGSVANDGQSWAMV